MTSVTGNLRGLVTPYVQAIGYDEFGQRTYVKYRNGHETSYEYDPVRRWLSKIRTTTGYGEVLQNMSYRFDATGNVLGYENDARTYETRQITYIKFRTFVG